MTTGSSTSEPAADNNDDTVHTTPAVHFTAETEMAVWGVNWAAGGETSFAYRVPRATPLPELGDQSKDPSEYAIRKVAAVFGGPDCVFDSIKVPKRGGGTDERGGDGIVLCGHQGIIIQSKNRRGPQRDTTEEIGWLESNIKAAYRQASGEYRALMKGPLELPNWRGRTLQIDGRDVDWTIVIIVNHPKVPDSFVPAVPTIRGKPQAIVLARRDWDFLYRHLRSNYAVINYLQRVRAEQTPPLGDEPTRYGEYALHDLGPGIPRIRDAEQGYYFLPLPGNEVDPSDLTAHLTLRLIMEQVAAASLEPGTREAERLSVLATLDTIPVVARTDLGKKLWSELADAREHPVSDPIRGTRVWGNSDGRPFAVLFGVASEQSDAVERALDISMTNCHRELTSESCTDDAVTVGVILIPELESTWKWRTLLTFRDGRLSP